jgi:hypothetical protein
VKLDKNLECICKVHTITIVDERTSSIKAPLAEKKKKNVKRVIV